MDFVSKLIALTHWRFVVQPRVVPKMIDHLRVELKVRGCVRQSDISDEIMLVLIQEAYRKAAAREKDNHARYGRLYEEIESMGKEIDEAFEGNSDIDPRIKSILEFHQLI